MGTKTTRLDLKFGYLLLTIMIDEKFVHFSGLSPGEESAKQFVISSPPLGVTILMFLNPTYWIPEAYCRGHWNLEKGDLGEFIEHITDNVHGKYRRYLEFQKTRPTFLHILKQKLFHRFFTRKVKTHYDLDPKIYEKFLDPELVYTCAFFTDGDDLAAAQGRKFATVLDRVGASTGDDFEVLNIGSGWGSFERFAVRNNAALKVTGLSISKKQIQWTENHNKSALNPKELARVQFVEEDYVMHQRRSGYDAVIAIGMVEHVGQAGYSEFFAKAKELLKDQGVLLIHMIVKPKSDIPTNPWLDKYIFPGGYTPSISELTKAAEGINLRVKNVHIHHPENYRKTLAAWRQNLVANQEEIETVYTDGYKMKKEAARYMYRQWEIYLAGSEASFNTPIEPLQIAQFVYEKK